MSTSNYLTIQDILQAVRQIGCRHNFTNRKYRNVVPKVMTFEWPFFAVVGYSRSPLQWRNDRYFALFHRFQYVWGKLHSYTVCNKNVAQRIQFSAINRYDLWRHSERLLRKGTSKAKIWLTLRDNGARYDCLYVRMVIHQYEVTYVATSRVHLSNRWALVWDTYVRSSVHCEVCTISCQYGSKARMSLRAALVTEICSNYCGRKAKFLV